jgi:hypothetical protein
MKTVTVTDALTEALTSALVHAIIAPSRKKAKLATNFAAMLAENCTEEQIASAKREAVRLTR